MIYLETDRLILRDYTTDDFEDFYRLKTDDQTMYYMQDIKLDHMGYFTYPRFWGRGYTTEALKKVIEYSFAADNVYRITTGCLAENIGSERVMQKCRMIKEAEHVDYEWHDGKMKTRLEYRLLKSEWIR